MKRYLFFVNQLYSYSILRPLQETIWARGDEVSWFFIGCSSEFLTANEKKIDSIEAVKAYKPHAVFAPGDWVPYFFPGIKVQVFHGVARNKRGHGEARSDHYNIRGIFDLYCTHAQQDTERFKQLAEKHQNFCAIKTGWPKLDPLFNNDTISDLKANINTQKPIILYASTFSRSVTSTVHLYDKIKALTEQGQYHWLITLHPKMESDIVNRYRQLSGPNVSFFESDQDVLPLLKAADIMLCDTSSIMFEFLMLEKPLITFRSNMAGPYLLNITSESELESTIKYALTRPDSLLHESRKFCSELHEFKDGKSSERILDAIDIFAKEYAHKLKEKPLNLIRKFKIRKKMKYYKIW